MIIGAGDFQLPLVEKAAEKYDVILVAPSVDERFDKLILRKYLYDVRDKETILEIAEKEGIAGVVTDQTDIPVRTVAYVAENIGLNGIGYEVSRVFTDKNLMREKLKASGLPYLPYLTASSYEEALKFFEELNSDVIVKPLDTQGSRGVFRVSNADELKKAFESSKSFSSNNTALIKLKRLIHYSVTPPRGKNSFLCGKSRFIVKIDCISANLRNSLTVNGNSLNNNLVADNVFLNKRGII